MKRIQKIHRWITGLGWTDLGCALALCNVGSLKCKAGEPWVGLFLFMMAVIVYCAAPRAKQESSPAAGGKEIL